MALKLIPATNSKRQVRKEVERYERRYNCKAVGKRQKYILTGFKSVVCTSSPTKVFYRGYLLENVRNCFSVKKMYQCEHELR